LACLAAATFLACTVSFVSRAQTGPVIIAALDIPYLQDFDSLASAGTSSALPTGWEFFESGTNANTTYTAGTGSGNAGDTYSFGAAGGSDRALGGLLSGSLTPLIGAAFTNDTGQTITSIDVGFTGEQWRVGATGRVDRLDFQYSLDASGLTTGTWVDVDALDFTAPNTVGPVGALNGEANEVVISGSITGISVPPGVTIRFRWVDFNATGADDGLAVDDFTMTPHGGGAPTVSIRDVSVAEGDSGTVTASFAVTVSTASHGGVSFDVATADGSGAAAATTADGDYVARALSSIVIPPGATTYTFDVTINGDTTVEPDESFVVNLSAVTGATLADGQAVGQIDNDDEPPPVLSDVAISQVYGGGGNSGATLRNDFIELFNRGTAAVSLDGWSVQYNSAAGTGSWQVTPLAGSIAPGGYYLIQEAAGTGGTTPLPTPDAIGTIALAAGSGKVSLQPTGTPISGACPLSSADLVGYGTTTCFEGLGPTAALSNSTAALRVRGGCFDSDNNATDFGVGNPSPRNSAAPARNCLPVPAAIHDIQGSAAVSPFFGQEVLTSGVVTGVKTNGFFLQAPDALADSNPSTSEGIFVFTAAMPAVTVGNEVSARGTVGEFFTLTQLESSVAGDVTVTAPSATLPSAVTLTTTILDRKGTPDQLERLEGMRVHADSVTSVAPTNEFGEIAAVLTGVARPLREPGISVLAPVPPDPTTGTADCCIPRFDENPERIVIDSDGLAGALPLAVTSNVVITDVTGPLDFSFGAYKLLPQEPPAAGANMSGVAVPAPAADEFAVAGFNIENFAGNETRRRKASLAIRQLMQSPDVIGHIEILDLATLQGLADQVNADAVAAGAPDPGYQAVLIPTPAGGTQNVGFLVKTSRVRIDSVSQELAAETFTNPNNGQQDILHDRPPLVLRATVDAMEANPRAVIVVVNHLRSFIDIELVGGEGPRVRAKRKAQAESVAGLLQELQTLNPGTAVISVGDYNAYQFNDGYTDPMATLKGEPTPDDQLVVDGSPDLVNPNFVNLVDTLPPSERYSFIFEGTPQALDHVLVNTVAAGYAQRLAIARGNSDFPAQPESLFAGDVTRPERSSDHDMPVAYFRFPPPSADLRLTMTALASSVAAGSQVTFTITVTNVGPSPAELVVVTDQLPSSLALVSCQADGGACGGSSASPTATFGSLAPGASAAVTIVAAAGCGVVDNSSIVNSATVAAVTADSDLTNNVASAMVVASNPAPTIADVAASRTQLLVPLHQMVPVTIGYVASDACGAVTSTLSVTSDEPVTGPILQQGLAGLTSPDWQVVDMHTVLLRAERSLRGDGRVYTIRITSVDAAGGIATSDVTVSVPRFIMGWRDPQ
jgi:hypothetical protein